MGQAVPYKGMFRKLRVKHEGLLAILLEGEQSVTASVAAPAIAISHSRKEYSFLKPVMINEDCSKRELTKFIKDARTWLNKTLTEDEKQEPGMVLAVIRSVLDSGWTEILDRAPGIEKMSYENITEVMLADFLERHTLVVHRINALRIIKDKDESISDCMRRIHYGYISAELNKAPLETLVLLHLLILHPADPLSEKIKSW